MLRGLGHPFDRDMNTPCSFVTSAPSRDRTPGNSRKLRTFRRRPAAVIGARNPCSGAKLKSSTRWIAPRRSGVRVPLAPSRNSAGERQLVGRFAAAVQSGDVDGMVALLTDDAPLTMPPQPLEYQGHEAIAAFLRHRAELRGAQLRVVPTRANTQPAFGCYLPDAHAAIARPYGLIVLTLAGDAIAAITWFADTGVFRHFGLPRTLRS